MINLQQIVNPAVNEYRATSIANAMKRPDIGLIQATQLSGKLLLGGALDIAQGTVMCGTKLAGAYLLNVVEKLCALFEKECNFEKNAWTSHYSFSESLAEAAKVVKTTLLLPTAFVGPFKPQWVALCSEILGVTTKPVSLANRIFTLALSIILPMGALAIFWLPISVSWNNPAVPRLTSGDGHTGDRHIIELIINIVFTVITGMPMPLSPILRSSA